MKVAWFSHSREPDLNRELGDYIALKVWGERREFVYSTTMGVFDGGELIAALVYYDFDRSAGVIQISGAAESARWLTRPVLWEMFDYPFNQLGCQAVVMRVDPSDKRLNRILTAYGFNKIVLPRLRGRDKDEALYTLFDDVWRSNKFNKGAQVSNHPTSSPILSRLA